MQAPRPEFKSWFPAKANLGSSRQGGPLWVTSDLHERKGRGKAGVRTVWARTGREGRTQCSQAPIEDADPGLPQFPHLYFRKVDTSARIQLVPTWCLPDRRPEEKGGFRLEPRTRLADRGGGAGLRAWFLLIGP